MSAQVSLTPEPRGSVETRDEVSDVKTVFETAMVPRLSRTRHDFPSRCACGQDESRVILGLYENKTELSLGPGADWAGVEGL